MVLVRLELDGLKLGLVMKVTDERSDRLCNLYNDVCSYLTAREQELCRRRAKVEKLLAWKQKLDEEEREIERLEKEAVQGVASRRASSVNDSTVSGE